MSFFDLETVRAVVPYNRKGDITQELLDKIENCLKDPEEAEAFKQNFLTYSSLLEANGRLGKKKSAEEYVKAVLFVTKKLLGAGQIKAWAAIYPERYAELKAAGQDMTIANAANAFNRTRMVIKIMEQTLVPSYIVNAPLFQDALNELAMMIKDPNVKGLVKVKACETILQHTKQPDIIKNELIIGMEQQTTITELREVTAQLADTFKEALIQGKTSLTNVTTAKIIEGEYEEVEDDNESEAEDS